MSDQDAFERILASLYEAMLDDAYWPATSALIDAACGIKGNVLLIADDVQIRSIRAYYRGERRVDLERGYLTIYYPIDERAPRVLQLPDSRLAHVTDLFTPEELKTSPTYNEGLRRSGGQDGLNVRLDGPDDSHIAWVIADPVTPGGWESSQLALLEGLLPHIRQFVRVRQALVGAEALSTSMTNLLDTSRLGVLYLDRRGRVVAANDRARAILRQGDGVSDRDGELYAYIPTDCDQLKRLLARALPSVGGVATSGSMTLRRPSVLLPFVVHVKPVISRREDFGVQRVAALVLLVEPGRQSHIDSNVVAEVLGLTPGETQVAVWLAEGKTAREMARVSGRTEAAIHWHLRHIFRKHRVARQADLIRLVLSVADYV